MVRYALYRVLWSVPTVLGVSLVVFFITTLLPARRAGEISDAFDRDRGRYAALVERWRSQFLDLPRFVNSRPEDVRSRATDYVRHIVRDDDAAAISANRLVALGGAAFPYVLPELDDLPPTLRGRVAVALAPVAERMQVGDGVDLREPNQAAHFWTRFWDDRALDFSEPTVSRAVRRVAERGTLLRERDLELVDTYALGDIIQEIGESSEPQVLARLTRLAARISGRGIVVTRDANESQTLTAKADWKAWWFVHATDFMPLEGAARVAASLTETRYGKWLVGIVTGKLGVSLRDGIPIATKLRRRAPVTLLLTALAMLASYALAIVLGVLGAWRHNRSVDIALAFVLFAMYSLPTFWIAELLVGPLHLAAHGGTATFVAAAATLTMGSLATLTRYQRAALLEVVGRDYIRTAHAKGVSTFGVLTVHALRNAMMPTITLAGLQFPALVGESFVVEQVFGLPGLGWETLRAIQSSDTAWLVSTISLTAFATMIALVLSDLAYGALDPRIRQALQSKRWSEVR